MSTFNLKKIKTSEKLSTNPITNSKRKYTLSKREMAKISVMVSIGGKSQLKSLRRAYTKAKKIPKPPLSPQTKNQILRIVKTAS